MRKRHSGFTAFSSVSSPLLLLLVSVLAYGLLIPQLGFYWDDLLSIWIRYQLGPEAMERCFAVSRPVLGAFFQLTTLFIPPKPLYWQVFALFWRWVTAVTLWALLRSLWGREHYFALVASLLFLVYPGFNQQFVAYIYGHYFAVLFFYLASLLGMVWSLRHPRWFWPMTLLSMLSSAANLWMMEYFFLLEFLRPVLIWIALREAISDFRPRLRRSIMVWLPYLAVFLVAVLWRVFVFKHQLYAYRLLPKMEAEPLATLLYLGKTVLTSLWLANGVAWWRIFVFSKSLLQESYITFVVYAMILVVTCIILIIYLLKLVGSLEHNRASTREHAFWAIGLGLLVPLIAGWPFWLIELPPSLSFPLNRFTLPFMLGVSLLLAGLLELLPHRNMKMLLSAVLISLAVGRHFLWAQEYHRDWETQKSLFWQLSWRVPGLKPDTLLLLNDGVLRYYADTSLSAAVNWIYAPDNRSDNIYYLLFHPRSRLGGSLSALEENLPVRYNFLAGTFSGNTSQSVALHFRPPACLRVLDPSLDAMNPFLPDLMRVAAPLSTTEPILIEGTPYLPEIYYPEPPHQWCYYFEKADLARQQGDWRQVAELGDEALQSGYYPSDPVEQFVFIEGYAHVGNWGRAQRLSIQSYSFSPSNVGQLLCGLWDRMAANTPDTPEKQSTVQTLQKRIGCYP